MTEVERDRMIYREAKKFLPSMNISGVTPELITKYLQPKSHQPHPKTIPAIYLRLLKSAQNANMKSNVIGKAIGGVETLGRVLFDFDPHKTLHRYGSDWSGLLDEIVEKIKPNGKIPRAPQSIWPKYCRSILSGASFLVQFKSSKDFFRWVDIFDSDPIARPSLPMLLSREIDGFGFALSCDFLKEMGYVNYAKPDVHLRDIFGGLGLCEKPKDDYILTKSIIRMATNVKVTPYNVDKVFWLIGSGNFYKDKHIGKKGRVGSHKAEFIKRMKAILKK